MDFATVLAYLAVAIAVACASITLTRARIFEPVRDWAFDKNYLLFKLVSCPYCMSHWLSLWLVPSLLMAVTDTFVLDMAITWFFLTGLAALFEGVMMNGLHMSEHRIQGLEDDLYTERNETRRLLKQNSTLQAELVVAREQGVFEGRRLERESRSTSGLQTA
jgi:hypothetical protein